ncbi:flagellar motor protein MotB [Thalassospira sp.]|uniref:flagellar motor protein MotB n=1 Tax=Thalassospira sp. TaxID=1912094 RepID=UPI00273552D6|nr:flagellar motor protein MotB [Thalassospira sp.]MDP2697840.1 flagellar motor protein MotB [Thalassospira sp.]
MPDIVIKKIKKGGHGHHGGAWKVAYADFVTAMMAFFLLLWLLSSATDEQLQGIANYFSPETVSSSDSGSGGILGGTSLAVEGSLRSEMGAPSVSMPIPPPQTPEQAAAAQQARIEDKEFDQAAEELREALKDTPELAGLFDNLIIDETDEGLRIQIVDKDGTSMFPSGSPAMNDHTRQLLAKVAEAIEGMPQDIAIDGHTDSVPFGDGSGDYSNWELSADRALATRRELGALGLPDSRFGKVSGRADTDPLLPDAPNNEQNRRISITLLRGTGDRAALGTEPDGTDVQPSSGTGLLPPDTTPPSQQTPGSGGANTPITRPTFSVPSRQ